MFQFGLRPHRALARAARAAVEGLEERRLLSSDPFAYANQVQNLPFALDFTHQVNGLLDASGQSIGFTRVQVNRNGDQYQPSLIQLNTSKGELDLTSRGTDTSGSNFGTDNTLVNALETEFDATSRGFTVTARLKGPLTMLSAPFDQSAIYFGPDDDNYVKFAAEYDSTHGQTLQFVDEQVATTHTVNVYQSIGSFASINTLDLRLSGDAVAGSVTASYSINGGTYAAVPGTVTLSDPEKTLFFNDAGRAGIFVATRNSLAPITVPFGHFEIDPGTPMSAGTQATVTIVHPADGDTNVSRDQFVSVDFHLPNGGIDNSTLYTASPPAVLLRTSDHAMIPAIVNTSGGGDAVVLQPQVLLDPNTTYTFILETGLKDVVGVPFKPYTMTFTTGTGGGTTDPTLAFEKVGLPTAQNAPFTCVRVGPDHKLYASTEDGRIFRWAINPDGTLGAAQIINALNAANPSDPGRLISGFAFDPSSTATNVKLWVSNGFYSGPDVYYQDNAPDFSDKITVMSGTDLQTVQDAVIHLPRSIRDHLTEQPTFGPDGALYFAQGSNTSYGAPDVIWGNRSEHLLTAAILRLDVTRITPGQPLDALTIDAGGTYNPFAAGAPLTIYASGVRNAFQLLWARDGTLFAPTNGSSAGGNTPAYPNPVNGIRIDQATSGPYTGPNVPAINGVAEAEDDWLFKIQPGGYYGHPDPARDEYVLNGGRPTAALADPSQVPDYPAGVQPDRNYRGYAFDFGQHRSPDGIVEYQGSAFNGALNGKLLIAEYSGGSDIAILSPDASDNITGIERGVAGLTGFQNPVNLCEDPTSGYLYVAELGGQKITLLRPVPPGAKILTSQPVLAFNASVPGYPGGGVPSHVDTLTITNTGIAPLTFPADGFTILKDPTDPADESAAFAITNRLSLPGVIQPGQSAQVQLDYTASSANVVQSAVLQIKSNDPASPVINVALHGLGTTGFFGYNEPSLVNILRAFDIPTIVGAGPNDANASNSQYPLLPDPSSQEVSMQRLIKAGPGPVTITPLASFDTSTQPALRLGYYTPGSPSDTSELFSINQSDAQTVNPAAQGATSFDPGSATFGLYAIFPGITTGTGQPDIHYSEDAFNTLDSTYHRKFRFFPLENPDRSIVPNAYIVAAEDFNSAQYNSFTNFVGVIRNVAPAPDAVGAPVLGLENLDGLPFTDRLAFNRIQILNDDTVVMGDVVHDTATLRIHNSGDVPLVISALTLSDTTNWQIVNPPVFPVTVGAKGGVLDVTIKFIANSDPPHSDNQSNDTQNTELLPPALVGGVWNGTLTIASNDPVNPARTVQLAGYWQHHSEYEEEPSFQTIVNLLEGYGTNIAVGQLPQYPNNGATPVYYGEEVPSPYWYVADPSLPVSVRQLAAFHSQEQGGTIRQASIGWYAQGNPGNPNWLFTHQPRESQSLLPTVYGSYTTPAAASFSTSAVFGWNVDYSEFSDDSLNTPDITTFGRSGHAIRFYPVRDRDGKLIPNTWLMGMDYQNGQFDNSDFQDNLYLVSNMRPADRPPAPSDVFAVASPSGGLSIQWAPVAYLGKTYNVYRASSMNGPYTKLNSAPLNEPGFLDTSAPAGVTSYYRVTAVSATTGIESSATNASATPAPTTLPATLTSLDINASQPGSTTVIQDGSDYDVVAGGPAVYGTADAFRFLYKQEVGDFDVKVRLNSISTAGAIDQAGLMARASLDPSSPDVFVSASPDQGFRFKDRDTPGAATNDITATVPTPYPNVWVRLQRSGNTFTGSYSTDGLSWTAIGTATVPMSDPIYLGLAAAANTTTATITAQFRAFEPTALPAPVTNIAAAAPDSAHVSLTWSAAAGATSYVVQRRGTSDSAYLTLAQNVAGTSYTDPTVQAGASYSYRVVASGAAGPSPAFTPSASVYVPLAGDINRDGKVDFTDLVILARNYGRAGATWDTGDLDGDGKVDFADLVILARHYGSTGSKALASLRSLLPS